MYVYNIYYKYYSFNGNKSEYQQIDDALIVEKSSM